MRKNLFVITVLCSLFISLVGCKNTTTEAADIQETAQQVGDVMASVDEVGGSSGNIAANSKSMQNSIEKTFERFAPGELNDFNKNSIASILQPKAYAAACAGAGFSTCTTGGTGGVITRTFGMCTIGAATFDGTVTLTWANSSAANCTLGTCCASSWNPCRMVAFL